MKQKWMGPKLKKLVLCLVALCFGAAALVLAINAYIVGSVQSLVLTPEQVADRQADCILVLGAGVYRDGTPSPMLADRLSRGLVLYELGASDRLLMSGDHGRTDYDEVNAMKGYATDAGVPSQDVFMDHAGFSTYESLYRARDVFQADSVIVVTQQYHLYRALYIARCLGLDAWGVAAPDVDYAGQEYRDLREMLARTKDFFLVMVMPKPTYLGQAIPVNGDGDATND